MVPPGFDVISTRGGGGRSLYLCFLDASVSFVSGVIYPAPAVVPVGAASASVVRCQVLPGGLPVEYFVYYLIDLLSVLSYELAH